MIWLSLLLVTSLEGAPKAEVTFAETEVFRPFVDWEVMLGDDESLFVINYEESLVLHYDATGKLQNKLGGKGRGPGEFTYPMGMWFQNGKLYVFDILDAHVSEFNSADGRFIRKFETPSRGMQMAKLGNGWALADWFAMATEPKPGNLFLTNEDMSDKRVVVPVPDPGFSQGSLSMSRDGKKTFVFSPISTRPTLVQGPSSQKVYLTDGQQFKITVIDADGQLKEITHERQRIPFDEDWAEENFKKIRANNKNLGKVTKNYPDYFPAIRELKVLRDGTLIVDRWRGRPDTNHYPIALNASGKEVPMPFSWDVLDRMTAESETHLFLVMYNEETEEGEIAKVRKPDAQAFVEANPINFDGSIGHNWSISH